MGYLHHWRPLRSIADSEWEALRLDAERLFRALPALPSARLPGGRTLMISFEARTPDLPPEASGETIRFNGVGDGACETFRLARAASGYDYCKTNGLPYDAVVTAVLALAQSRAPGWLAISSDGTAADWERGLRLLDEAFGPDPRRRVPPGVLPWSPDDTHTG
jgi:hypothetical protein